MTSTAIAHYFHELHGFSNSTLNTACSINFAIAVLLLALIPLSPAKVIFTRRVREKFNNAWAEAESA